MKTKKFLSLMLVICLSLSVMLVACSTGNSTDESGKSAGGAGSDKYTDENGNYKAEVAGDYPEDVVITFLTCGVNAFQESEIIENVYSSEQEAKLVKVLNDDLGKRQDKLKEELGITIRQEYIFDNSRYNGQFAQKVRNENIAPTGDFQIVVPCLYDAGALAVDDQLVDLRSISTFQLDAPWWNAAFNDALTYGDQLYFTIGDIGLVNKNATASLYFNYDLWEKYGLSDKYDGNPYDLVRNGDWTVDVVFAAAKAMGRDLNSDGVINYEDEFGWGGQLDDMWSIFFGSGAKIASADADGYPTITIYNEKNDTLVTKLQEFVKDKEHYISANDYFGVAQWPSVLVQAGFTEGRALFYNGGLGTIIELGDMTDHFGIVPIPKGTKDQDDYYSLVNPWTSTCFAIPKSIEYYYSSDLDMIADCLDWLGAYSKNTLSKDYEESVLTYMKTRDDDSIDMIKNYILPTRACDIGMIFKFGDLDGYLHDLAKNAVGTFRSGYEAKASAAKAQVEKTVEFFKDHEK